MSIKSDLQALPAKTNIPKDWQARVEVSEHYGTVVTGATDKSELDDVEQKNIVRDIGKLDPDQWTIVGYRKSSWQNSKGEWLTSHKLELKPKTTSQLLDLDDLHKSIAKIKRKSPPHFEPKTTTEIVVIADAQVGKVDVRGGTEELLARLEDSRIKLEKRLKKSKPEEIILIDAGDAIENFESGSGTSDRTNDLQLTEQIRIWRRIFWSWIETCAQYSSSVKVYSVGSNHCRVRRGKSNLGPPSDDYGLEILSQLADMASVYPQKYSHVSFHAPDTFEESIAIPTSSGKMLGLVHGHQVSNADQLPVWWAKQSLGKGPVGDADILVAGHFHHFRLQSAGNNRWVFVAPSTDNGSAWFQNTAGVNSPPGVLTFKVDESGWKDIEIL